MHNARLQGAPIPHGRVLPHSVVVVLLKRRDALRVDAPLAQEGGEGDIGELGRSQSSMEGAEAMDVAVEAARLDQPRETQRGGGDEPHPEPPREQDDRLPARCFADELAAPST